MLVRHVNDVEPTRYEDEASRGVAIRPLISEGDGAPTFATRHFEIAPGGHTPRHSHSWEHEVFIISGRGTVTGPDGTISLAPGTAVFIPGHEEHQFHNTGDTPLLFTCAVPNEGRRQG
jgi:quercetin dioxygenase-like cupin family protein